MIDIKRHPGYFGDFTRNQAEGAIRNGTRIMKQSSEPGDTNPDGAFGTVLGSIDVAAIDAKLARTQGRGCPYFYFIEWRAYPGRAAGVAGFKIAEAS